MPEAPRIFVSHAHEDAAWCRAFVRALRAAGADVWYDEDNLGYGALAEEIERELAARPIFIVVLSPAAVDSPWVRRETDAAISLRDKSAGRLIVPVVAVPTPTAAIPLFWRQYHRIGGAGITPDEAAGRVLQAIASGGASTQPPAPPAPAGPAKRRPHVHPILRWPLRIYTALLLFVVFGIAGGLVLAPLAPGFSGLSTAVHQQIGNLVTFVQANVALSAALGLGLAALYVLSLWASIETKREQGTAITDKMRGIAQEEIDEASERLRPPPTPTTVVAPAGLPRPASLVGRADELRDLMARLRAGATTGVFAVEGMAGVGKTALAAEAVAQLSTDGDAFPGGAAWITCEGLAGPDGLAELWTRVARALALEEVAERANPEARRLGLAAALAQSPRLLLALDNIERGLDAAAAVDTLAIPGHTALLLTAREAVAPEKVTPLRLAPLHEPDAATLFAQRLAQAALAQGDPTRPTEADRAAIPALVEAVGGLPLAIELTAAYAGTQGLGLATVARELKDDGLDAAALQSTADARRAPAARFDRSWAVLAAMQQRLFASLSLLAGASFPRAAALALARAAHESTADATHAAPTPATPEQDLATLVAYALVDPLADERLRLHPLLREYAAARLKTLPGGAEGRLGDAMVAYWLEFVRGHPSDADKVDAEAEGIMGATEWAHHHGRDRDVIALARLLSTRWYNRGRRREAALMTRWADEAAQRTGDLGDQRWAAHQSAVTQAALGQVEAARAGYERALALAREMGDPAAERDEVHALAVLDARTGHPDAARAGYERALALARALGDPAAERAEVHGLAELDRRQGRLEAAHEGFTRALALSQQLDDPSGIRLETHQLALLDHAQGRLEAARAGYERALGLARALGDPAAERDEVHSLAALDAQTGHPDAARAGYERALGLARALGDPAAERVEVHSLAVLDARTGHPDAARAGYERALGLARALGDPAAERDEVHELAVLDARTGHPEAARAGYERALGLARALGDPAAEREEVHGLAVLDFTAGDRQGARARYEEALALARGLSDPVAEADELRGLGDTIRYLGELARARELLEESLAICERVGYPQGIAASHEFLARLDEQEGHRDAAIAHLREALRLYAQIGSPGTEVVRAFLRRLGVDA